jgi:glycosyltransferase involved in cell wall biosynthesis
MRRIKVCQVINAYQVGGAETVALDLARGLDPGRFESLALAIAEPHHEDTPDMLRRFQAAGVPAHALPCRRFGDWRLHWDLWRFLRRHRPDIVHGHNRPADYLACSIGRLAGVPRRIWTRHLVYRNMPARQVRRYGRLGARTPVVVAVSDAVREHCIATENIPADRVRTIVNGIDTTRFRPRDTGERAAKRAELDLANDDIMLLQVGRLADQKAPDAFVTLVRLLRERGLPIRGFLCGTGPLADTLADPAAEADVTLLGLRQDVPELLGSCDLVVSCSRVEGLPLNIMEAMAAGAPFVAPELPQIRQLVGDDPQLQRGLYATPPDDGPVPTGTIAHWADVVCGRLGDPAWLQDCGRRGREAITRHYSLTNMIASYSRIYAEIAGGDR